MTAQLYIEVPVYRRAAVHRIGVIDGRTGPSAWYLSRDPGIGDVGTDGTTVAVRPSEDMAFRCGTGRCVGRRLYLEGIIAACDGDIVYRVEDP